MKTKSKISGHILRSGAAAAFFLFVIVALSSAFNPNKTPKPTAPNSLPRQSVKAPNQARTLTFAERVAYQRAIEEIYWRHRIWPATQAGAKPSLDKVMPQAQIEKKVRDYLRNSQALEHYWQQPITPEQLQAEMERMARYTRQPEVLREIFAALGNDPAVVAECLARPALAERLVTNLYAHDERFHGELKRCAEAELQAHRDVKQMKQTSGTYTELEFAKDSTTENQPARTGENNMRIDSREWNDNIENLAAIFGNNRSKASVHSKGATEDYRTLPVGKLSPLQEDEGRYYAIAVIKKSKDTLKTATIAWLKEPLRSWLVKAETQMPVTMAAGITARYTLPAIAHPSGGCIDDTWTPTSITGDVPDARIGHTAVWTGSKMIVWGGSNGPT